MNNRKRTQADITQVRAVLHAAWPRTTFIADEDSESVGWLDGPSGGQVQAVIAAIRDSALRCRRRYSEAGFDQVAQLFEGEPDVSTEPRKPGMKVAVPRTPDGHIDWATAAGVESVRPRVIFGNVWPDRSMAGCRLDEALRRVAAEIDLTHLSGQLHQAATVEQFKSARFKTLEMSIFTAPSDGATELLIDAHQGTGRLRIRVNDGAVFDKDPDTAVHHFKDGIEGSRLDDYRRDLNTSASAAAREASNGTENQ